MTNEDITTHTADCRGGPGECERVEGDWLQPSGIWVDEATERLDDDAPWCRVQQLAWQLQAGEVE